MKKLGRPLCIIMTIFHLSGCASLDAHTTKFQPLRQENDQQVYLFSTFAGMTYPLDSKKAENARMEWLKTRLKEHGLDENNFKVIKRKAVPADGGLIGDDAYHLYYEVLTKEK